MDRAACEMEEREQEGAAKEDDSESEWAKESQLLLLLLLLLLPAVLLVLLLLLPHLEPLVQPLLLVLLLHSLLLLLHPLLLLLHPLLLLLQPHWHHCSAAGSESLEALQTDWQYSATVTSAAALCTLPGSCVAGAPGVELPLGPAGTVVERGWSCSQSWKLPSPVAADPGAGEGTCGYHQFPSSHQSRAVAPCSCCEHGYHHQPYHQLACRQQVQSLTERDWTVHSAAYRGAEEASKGGLPVGHCWHEVVIGSVAGS